MSSGMQFLNVLRHKTIMPEAIDCFGKLLELKDIVEFECLRVCTYYYHRTDLYIHVFSFDRINKSVISDPKECNLKMIALPSIEETPLIINRYMIRVQDTV